MRTLIIDNEPAMVRSLRLLLAHYCPEIDLLGEAGSVAAGLQAIAAHAPELVFLDIEMDDGTGMDLLRQVPERRFQVIFVTAYGHYAVEAFKFSAIDYLLKPIDPDDLMAAVRRARSVQDQARQQERLEVLLDNLRPVDQGPKKIVLSDAENLHVLEVSEILRCQAEGAYTRFVLTDGSELLVSRHLKAYEDLLEGYGFFRPHQSHLVNTRYIKRFHKADGGTLVMRDDSQVPVSSRRRAQLVELLTRL